MGSKFLIYNYLNQLSPSDHMKGLAFSSLRVGKKYTAVNYGERYDFEIHKILSASEFLLKDINTLETFYMSDIIRFGRGNDFEIREIYAN